MEKIRGRHSWIVLVIVNALVTFFGVTYLFPGAQDPEGALSLSRYVWGPFVIASSLAMLALSATAFRKGRRWAWFVAWYQLVFLVIAAVIGADYTTPTALALIVLFAMFRSYRRFFPGPERSE